MKAFLLVVALVVIAGTAMVHAGGTFLACSYDTAYCSPSSSGTVQLDGQWVAPPGHYPVQGVTGEYRIAYDNVPGSWTFTTNEKGAFCVVGPDSAATVDPVQLRDTAGNVRDDAVLVASPSGWLRSGANDVHDSVSADDVQRPCARVDAQPAWNDAEDRFRTASFWLPLAVAALAMTLISVTRRMSVAAIAVAATIAAVLAVW